MKSTQTVKGEAEVPSTSRSEPMKCHAIYIGKFFHINKTFFQVRGVFVVFPGETDRACTRRVQLMRPFIARTPFLEVLRGYWIHSSLTVSRVSPGMKTIPPKVENPWTVTWPGSVNWNFLPTTPRCCRLISRMKNGARS